MAASLQLTQIPSVETAMLIRRPAPEVFQAFVDPAVTTRFWFTKSSGTLTPGAEVHWEWEMYEVTDTVAVKDIEENRRILFTWSQEDPMDVEFRFTPKGDDATFVEITETGLHGSGDEILAHVAGATGAFTIVLCAAKAFLEHGVELGAVGDRFAGGIEH